MISHKKLYDSVLPTIGIAVIFTTSIFAFTITLSNYASDPVAPENFLHPIDAPYHSQASAPIQPPSCVEASGATVEFSPYPSAAAAGRSRENTTKTNRYPRFSLEFKTKTGGKPLINQAVNFSGPGGILENADLVASAQGVN